MQLSERQRKHLRRLAHDLAPVILLGHAGLTDGIVKETSAALTHHELIKARARVPARGLRDEIFSQLAGRTASTIVHRVGNVAVLFRRNLEQPKIILPD
jgi:RNA-binding protein